MSRVIIPPGTLAPATLQALRYRLRTRRSAAERPPKILVQPASEFWSRDRTVSLAADRPALGRAAVRIDNQFAVALEGAIAATFPSSSTVSTKSLSPASGRTYSHAA